MEVLRSFVDKYNVNGVLGSYVGKTWGRIGSVYLDIIKTNGMIKIIMMETKFGIPTTKKYSIILTENDFKEYLTGGQTFYTNPIMFPTGSPDNTFIYLNSIQMEVKEFNLTTFRANFYTDKNYFFGMTTKNIDICGYNFKRV
jgi:hypothetical protein